MHDSVELSGPICLPRIVVFKHLYIRRTRNACYTLRYNINHRGLCWRSLVEKYTLL